MFHSIIHSRTLRVLPAGDHAGLARPGRTLKLGALALLFPLVSQAANYSARKTVLDGVEVVQLADAARHLEVSIAVSIGNMAYEMNAGGKSVLFSPYHSHAELKAKPTLSGIPFLAPWANRIE